MIPAKSKDYVSVAACLLGVVVAMSLQNDESGDDIKRASSLSAHDRAVDVLVLMFGILFLALLLMLGLSVPLIVITGLITLLAGECWARHHQSLSGNGNAI